MLTNANICEIIANLDKYFMFLNIIHHFPVKISFKKLLNYPELETPLNLW